MGYVEKSLPQTQSCSLLFLRPYEERVTSPGKDKVILFQMGVRKLHVQTSSAILAARKILEQILKLLAHNEEVSSILRALSRTNCFPNILSFLL